MRIARMDMAFFVLLAVASSSIASAASFSQDSRFWIFMAAAAGGILIYRDHHPRSRFGFMYNLLLLVLGGLISVDRFESLPLAASVLVAMGGTVLFFVAYYKIEDIVMDAGLLDWYAFPDVRNRVFDAIVIATGYGLLGWISAWAINGTRADHYGLAVAGVLAALAYFAKWGYGSLLVGIGLVFMIGFIALGDAVLHQGAWGVSYAVAGIAAYAVAFFVLFVWAAAAEDKAMMEYDHGYAY